MEVSLLEMVHSTLCGATNAQLKSCWPTVQQLILESLLVVQVASSKLHLFKLNYFFSSYSMVFCKIVHFAEFLLISSIGAPSRVATRRSAKNFKTFVINWSIVCWKSLDYS